MRLIISFLALFVSVVLVQLGSGSLGPLDALSGKALDFSTREIGALGSAHFVGFIAGCFITPRIMANVGHSRAFAAMVSVGAVAALLHPVFDTAISWMILRVGGGAAVAGAYTVIESWLQAKASNSNRGRVSSVYRVVDLLGSLGAQLLIAGLEPASYVSYNIVACFMCLSLLPLTMTRAKAPPMPVAPRVSVIGAVRSSPLGALGVFTVGLTNSSFRMVGPVYADANGLAPGQIGLFLASAVLGGAIAQPFVGWISDKFDRRWVLIAVSMLAIIACGFIGSQATGGAFSQLLLASFLFGASAFPLYSISAAHANDFAPPEKVVELNASLVLMFGIGAVVSPLVASELISRYGPGSMFAYIACAHVGLIGFGLYRMTIRRASTTRTPYTYRPRTSITLERLVGNRERDSEDR